jgi:hypothetical protein
MGTLKYDGTTVVFDDRVLAHIQTVVLQKLRRQENFFLAWQDSEDLGGGRTGIWVHTAAILTFHFTTNDNPNIDRAWLEKLMSSANSVTGMFVTDADGTAIHPSDMIL